MEKYNFGEKQKEFIKGKGEVEVWQSPKYKESKNKAIEFIESKKYDLKESDFWILMNATQSGKMAYTGLIISHNGCLKINDNLDDKLKFKPECVRENQDGYKNSLVFTYVCPEQGIYEVGEVSQSNCKNEYPYAMAFKRCFDRVVLKNSKLAYAGVYSDSEAEEFKEKIDDEVKETRKKVDYNAKIKEYCKENNIDLREVAMQYKLNSKSTIDEFKNAYIDLVGDELCKM